MSEHVDTDPVGEQLSALMDGELPRDQLRFLLRRIDAEAPLAQRWSRYQMTRVVLRRQGGAQLRADFAEVLMQRLATEPAPALAVRRGARMLRWVGGGAIAASVAVLALVATRPPVPAPALVAAAAAPQPATLMTAKDVHPALPVQTPAVFNFDYAQPASFERPYGGPYGMNIPSAPRVPLLTPPMERKQPEAATAP